MKKYIMKIGNVVSILLMILPLAILAYNREIGKYWWILLILSICYDFYIYSLIQFNEKMEENKKLYCDVVKGKAIDSNTDEKKLKWYQVICIDILSEYFKDDFYN